MKFLTRLFVLLPLVCGASAAHAQMVTNDPGATVVTYVKAEVLEVISEEVVEIPGTQTKATQQEIRVELLEGAEKGKVLVLQNDYLPMRKGDVFFVRHEVAEWEHVNNYAVSDPYRLPQLALLVVLFLVCLFVFGGKQGVRGLMALVGSLFFIAYLLLPGILAGYSPVLVSVAVAALIIVLGSYVTHGFNKTTTAAVVGMIATVLVTGVLAYLSIHMTRLSGFSGEEVTYLNFATNGSIDFIGLLLGAMIIGFLGVLYDAAISQAIAVEELFAAGVHLTRRHVFERGLRIGREHVGALVNTLAIAYVGAALPLILLFKASNLDPLLTLNQELFATEVVRMMVGSIGIILAVPVTTAIAVWMLRDASRA